MKEGRKGKSKGGKGEGRKKKEWRKQKGNKYVVVTRLHTSVVNNQELILPPCVIITKAIFFLKRSEIGLTYTQFLVLWSLFFLLKHRYMFFDIAHSEWPHKSPGKECEYKPSKILSRAVQRASTSSPVQSCNRFGMRLLSWKYFSTYKLRVFSLTSYFPSLLMACVTFTFWYVL